MEKIRFGGRHHPKAERSEFISRFALGVLILVGFAGSGCGKGEEESEFALTGVCSLADDQRQSFMAPVSESDFAMSIVVDSEFSDSQYQKIKDAAAEWNKLYSELGGGTFFRVSVGAIPAAVRTGNPDGCNNHGKSNARSFYLVKETSQAHWTQIGLSNAVPAATFRCFSSHLISQIMFVNPGVTSLNESQFQSVVLHELGHTVGLKHSCDESGGGTDKYVGCASLSASHPYRVAVMYPWLRGGTSTGMARGMRGYAAVTSSGEVKESLAPNDEERAKCFYNTR